MSSVVNLVTSSNSIFQVQQKDGGKGWVIAVICGFCFGINISVTSNYALFYDVMISVYNSTENNVVYSAWIGSTAIGIEYVFSSVGSILVDFYDARIIGIVGILLTSIGFLASAFVDDLKYYFISYSVLVGFGQSFFVPSFLSILPHYFKQRIDLANGLMILCSSVLTISTPFVVLELLNRIGLKNAFYCHSGFLFLSFLPLLSFKSHLKKDKTEKWNKRLKKSLGFEVLKMKKFIIWVIAVFIAYFGYLIPTIVISNYSKDKFPSYSPAILLAVFSLISGISGLFCGLLNNYFKIKSINFHILSFLIGGIIQIMIEFANSFTELCMIFAFYGIIDGLFLTFIVPVCCEITDSHILSNQAAGFMHFFIALPTIVGPVLAGLSYEYFGDYSIAFESGGICLILASIILIFFHSDSILRNFLLQWINSESYEIRN